ncbi:MAG: GatB/YqeY domain-containing protein [Muribaculaceae bacterium]|nr:GatB/YqeY domain-containing protein [Muribaculaceae bacterium]
MNLFDQISEDIKTAMKARDKVRLEALRGIKKEFIEAKTAPGAGGELSDDQAMKILVKLAKQRRESAKIYQDNNRPELAENELAEMNVIEEYLPKALSPEELDAELRRIIAEVGASSPADMGKVMGVATKALAGRADGREISTRVRALLVG